MDKLLLKKWSDFKYGARQSNNVLQEVKQHIVDKFQRAIELAESGRLSTFAEVFGNGTEEDPKLRRIMPYSLDDNGKFLNILQNIRYKERQRIYKMVSDLKKKATSKEDEEQILIEFEPFWNPIKKTVQMKKKPLGWREGDEIPTVDVDTVSLSLDFGYKTEKSKGRTITSTTPFFKLLEKYYPNEVEWWQGNKAKGINGRQTFFSNNYKLVQELAKEASYGYTQPPEVGGVGFVVVLTRHPIDVLRMSDFSNIRSCHSPEGEYFSNCQQEVASGGGVIFLVDKDEFNKAFPDGIMPQKGEIFKDNDRSVRGYIDEPEARLRLRRVELVRPTGEFDEIAETDVSFAVPDKRIYGEQISSFREQTFKYFGELQKDKFIKDGKLVLPNINKLQRYGGQYEDGGENNVGSNFVKLVRTAVENSQIESKFEILNSSEFVKFSENLRYDSIEFGGGDPSEFEDVEEADYSDMIQEEFEDTVRYKIRSLEREYNSNESMRVSVETYIQPLNNFTSNAKIDVRIRFGVPRKLFVSEEMIDMYMNGQIPAHNDLREDNIPGLDVNFQYPEMDLDDIYIGTYGDSIITDFTYEVSSELEYEEDYGVRGLSWLGQQLDDMRTFIEFFSDMKEGAQIFADHLSQFGLVTPPARIKYKDQIDQLKNNIIEDNDFEYESKSNKDIFTYSKVPLFVFTFPYSGKFENTNKVMYIEQTFESIFHLNLNNKIDAIQREIKNQMPLFKDIPAARDKSFVENFFHTNMEPRIRVYSVDAKSSVSQLPIAAGTSSKVRVDFYLKVELDNQSHESIIVNSLALLNAIVQNKEMLDDLAMEAFSQAVKESEAEQLVTAIRMMQETKKQRFKRLLKEYARKNKGLVR